MKIVQLCLIQRCSFEERQTSAPFIVSHWKLRHMGYQFGGSTNQKGLGSKAKVATSKKHTYFCHKVNFKGCSDLLLDFLQWLPRHIFCCFILQKSSVNQGYNVICCRQNGAIQSKTSLLPHSKQQPKSQYWGQSLVPSKLEPRAVWESEGLIEQV